MDTPLFDGDIIYQHRMILGNYRQENLKSSCAEYRPKGIEELQNGNQ